MPTIELASNLNGKIGCQYMAHIMKPRTKAFTAETWKQVTTFKAPGVQAEYLLVDYAEDPVSRVPQHIFRLSHGMEQEEFLQWCYQKLDARGDDKVGIYFFRLK